MNKLLCVLILSIYVFQWIGDDSYNCHNYAWQAERGWLEDPSEYITQECPPEGATRVVYYAGSVPIHSGLYLGSGWVKSKWGSNPVVIHPWWFSTYGRDVKYYK